MRTVAAAALVLATAACGSLGGTGPTTRAVVRAGMQQVDTAQIKVIPVEHAIQRGAVRPAALASFAETFGDSAPAQTIIGRGDALAISIWEAPPAVLFGATATFGGGAADATVGSGALAGGSVAQQSALPETMVDNDGLIRVPFAGSVRAAGLTPRQLEREIVARLARKAHEPQAIVRIARNISSGVNVLGDVANNGPVALTPRGERLLDVLSAAGGVRKAPDKTMVQVTRDGVVARMPLSVIMRDQRQNIRLRPDDLVTAISEEFSFTALGESGTTAEIPFESTGITLAQALGRAGGLKPDRADASGVFVFRLEDPAALDAAILATSRRTADGRIPVVYVLDMKQAAALFNAQMFAVRDEDVVYIARAPLTDLQRIVSTVGSIAFPLLSLTNYVN
ncbi:MAG TPA: polysaccharide biosynthesis/export family protein [Sphingomicrobium sp.]